MKAAAALAALILAIIAPTAYVPYILLATGATAVFVLGQRPLFATGILCASTLVFATLVYGMVGAGPATHTLGPLSFDLVAAKEGTQAAARLASTFLVIAVAHHFVPPSQLLPFVARKGIPAYLAGALLRLVPTLAADAARLRDAQRARGHRFRKGVQAPRSWIPLLVPLCVITLRRAREQSYALRLAGLGPDPRGTNAIPWATVAALTALTIAGRLLVPVPGLKLSPFLLFLSGVAMGPRVGALVGFLSRAATDWAISGPMNPTWVVMAPLDAGLGAAAGLLGRYVDFGQRGTTRYRSAAIVAGATGSIYILVFSVVADTLNWFLLPLLGVPVVAAAWKAYVLAGLAFNALPAYVNAAVFALATWPVLRALHAHGLLPASKHRRARTPQISTTPHNPSPAPAKGPHELDS